MDNLDYGIIGNCRSAALVSKSGSIDWCCLPEFDSSSIFAKLLDEDKGGCFEILTDSSYSIVQHYYDNTSILVTTFSNGTDAFEVYDFMPRYIKEDRSSHTPPEIIRFVKLVSGKPHFSIRYNPKLEYAMGETISYIKKDHIVSLTRNEKFDSLYFYSNLDLDAINSGKLIILTEDSFFQFGYNEKIFKPSLDKIKLELERTKVYWLNWSEKTISYQRYNKEIQRSAITLKLLSYEKTGAVMAAVTTSLPETIGEVRNWDYRFCWIRDASMVVKVLSVLGHKMFASNYLRFIIDLIPDKDEKLQIMYSINKGKQLTEQILDHLKGYQDSKPVRIGNAAYLQRQNDIYGILMDVIYHQFVHFSTDIDNGEEMWDITKGIEWLVEQHWQETDKGIWEFRTEDRHFTFSKVLCWTAIDRAIKVARIIGKNAKAEKWEVLRDTIRKDIMEKAWNEEVQAFTQSYGSSHLDASVLLMEDYGILTANDPKYISTVKAIGRELNNDGLLYRYKNKDDFGSPTSSFTICTFWYINSLYKIGNYQEAKMLFERMLTYSNHLGLFSEDLDFKTKRLLGNFPQAYSHLALIETAINLSQITHEEEIIETLN